MAIRTYDILLDSYNSTIPEPIVGRQGDKNGAVTLHVTITDRGTAVDLNGQTINLMAETAKRTSIIADNGGVTITNATDGKFDYAIPNALWSEAGKITKAYFSLNDANGQQTTYDLIFIVKKSIDISQDKADDYVTIIDGTLRDLKTKTDAIYASFSAGDFYNKGQIDAKLAQTNSDLDTGLAAKISKGENESISKSMLTQDFRDELANGEFTFSGNTSDIEDGAVTAQKRTNLGEMGAIFSASAPNFDFNDKVLRIEKPFRMIHRDKFYIIGDDLPGGHYTISLDNPDNQNRTYGMIYFNTETKLFSVRDVSAMREGSVSESDILIAWFRETSNSAGMIGPFTINGKTPQPDGEITIRHLSEDILTLVSDAKLTESDFEIGSINIASAGQNNTDNTCIRTIEYHRATKGSFLINKNLTNQLVAIWFYDLNKKWLSEKTIGFDDEIEEYKFDGDYLIRIVTASRVVADRNPSDSKQFSSLANNILFVRPRQSVTVTSKKEQPAYVNDTGKKLVFKFPIKLKNSYMSDHTFVGDELWIFPVSSDDHTNWSTVMRYSVDVENKTATILGTFDHNWGHVNSIDYNENTDALVCGNGGGSGNTQPDEFYVFENASQLKNITQVDVHEHAIVYQVEQDGFDWGKQLNTTWGQANGGKYNIVYVLSNYNSATGTADNSTTSSDTQAIHKVLLGQGANQLENGTFIEGKSGLEYNGTYKVLKKYTHPYEYDYANQGTTFYNGKIYEGIGHNRLSFFEKILDDSGEVKSVLNRERLFDDTGSELGLTVEGLEIKDGLLYLGEESKIIYVYKL